MSAARAFLPLTLVLFVTLGCTSDRVVAPQDRGNPSPRSIKRSERIIPAFEVHRRLPIVYFQLELHWVMRGKYPKSLRELVIQSPSFPFPTLKADLIVDPYSAYRLPLRYRVTDDGPELAGIGPDRRWGGWPSERHVNFYSLDDVRLTRASLKGCLQRYLHATFFQAVENERIPRLSVGTDYIDAEVENGAAVNALLRTRVSKTELRASGPSDLLDGMKDGFNMLLGVHKEFALPDDTGFDSWSPRGPRLGRLSLYHAVGILLESSSSWIATRFFAEQTFLGTDQGHGHVDHEEVYSFLMLLRWDDRYAGVRDDLIYLPYDQPLLITVSFPWEWFTEDQLARLGTAIERFSRRIPLRLTGAKSGIAVYHLDPWGMTFFFIDRFRDHVLDWLTTLELHGELPELDDAE